MRLNKLFKPFAGLSIQNITDFWLRVLYNTAVILSRLIIGLFFGMQSFASTFGNYVRRCLRVLILFKNNIASKLDDIVQKSNKGIAMLTDEFKSVVVNSLPTGVFLAVARVLPIGAWLEKEEIDPILLDCFYRAMRSKNLDRLKNILSVCSEESLYTYLTRKNLADLSPLMYVTDLRYDPVFLKTIIHAVKPSKRLWLLDQLTHHFGYKYVFHLADFSSEVLEKKWEANEYIEIIMQALPEQDRFKFINQTIQAEPYEIGNTPTMIQAIDWSIDVASMHAIFKYCPEEERFNYLAKFNRRGRSVLIELAAVKKFSWLKDIMKNPLYAHLKETLTKEITDEERIYNQNWLEELEKEFREEVIGDENIPLKFTYLLNSIPENQRQKFLNFRNQGNRIKVYAYINGYKGILDELRKYGYIMPRISKDEAIKLVEEEELKWRNEGQYEILHREHPLKTIGLNENQHHSLEEIKTKYQAVIRKIHPDRNLNSQQSNVSTINVLAAYREVYKELDEKYRDTPGNKKNIVFSGPKKAN